MADEKFDDVWGNMPPEKGGAALYGLAMAELQTLGKAITDHRKHQKELQEKGEAVDPTTDATLRLFNTPGDISRVMEAAVRLVELGNMGKPVSDPYGVNELTPPEYYDRVYQGIMAWHNEYTRKYKRVIKPDLFKQVLRLLRALILLEELPQKFTEPVPKIPQKNLDALKEERGEESSVQNW